MTSSKSSRVALRLPISIISRLWNSGSENAISSRTMPTRMRLPPVRHLEERSLHRAGASGSVEHCVEPEPLRDCGDVRVELRPNRKRGGEAELLPSEVKPLLGSVHHRDGESGDAGEDGDAEADRAGAPHESARAGPCHGTSDGMRTDRQELDHRGIPCREPVGRVEVRSGKDELLAQAASRCTPSTSTRTQQFGLR